MTSLRASLLAIVVISVLARTGLADDDQRILSVARAAFKQGDFITAVREYRRIDKSSLRWSLAKEELAWSYFRSGDYAQAMSQARSLTNVYMNHRIDLEPYLLQSLILFYNCDYTSVFKLMKDVRETMGGYVTSMETLKRGDMSPNQHAAVRHLLQRKTYAGMSPKIMSEMPRRFELDDKIFRAVKAGDEKSLRARLVQLAQRDDQRIGRMLNYLKLVEVESVQRAFVPSQFTGLAKSRVPKSPDTMVFNNDKELWADEIDKTQADITVCKSKTGSTL